MAGAGYKLFNTGDVLTAAQVNTYLQEQAVMRFANAAARTTALSGVLAEGMMSYLDDTNAVEVYNGSAWVSISADQTPLTTKGDLFTYSTTDARLGVGANGETLVADSSTTTGLRWQGNFAAGKNVVINGDFGIWQRGTSFTANGYTSDRWRFDADGTGSTNTISRQTFTPGTAPVAGYESTFFLRIVRSAIGSSNTFNHLKQFVEDVRMFAGQTVTLSFWAKADTSRNVVAALYQVYGSGGSATTGGSIGTAAVTTSWQRFSFTTTLGSMSGKTIGTNSYLAVQFEMPAAVASTIEFWGVQLEASSVATAFQTATGTLAGELAACQRYYIRYIPASTGSAGAIFGPIPTMTTTTIADTIFSLPVEMRANPSALDANELGIYRSANAVRYDTGTFTLSGTTRKIVNVRYTHGTAIFTAGETGLFVTTGTATNPFVGFSAEL